LASATGRPVARDTTEGVLIVAFACFARGGGLAVLVTRVQTFGKHRKMRVDRKPPAGSGTGAEVPTRRHENVRGRRRNGKGCSSRRGEDGPSRDAPRGVGPRSAFRGLLGKGTRERYAARESSEPWTTLIEAGRANCPAILTDKPKPRERKRAGSRTLTPIRTMLGTSRVH